MLCQSYEVNNKVWLDGLEQDLSLSTLDHPHGITKLRRPSEECNVFSRETSLYQLNTEYLPPHVMENKEILQSWDEER